MTVIKFAPDIDPAARALSTPGRTGAQCRFFSPTEFRLFTLLYEADLEHGQAVSIAELLGRLYAGRSHVATPHTLRSYISKLRGRLAGSRFRIDKSDGGYRLVVTALPPTPPPAVNAARSHQEILRSLATIWDGAMRLYLLLAPAPDPLAQAYRRLLGSTP